MAIDFRYTEHENTSLSESSEDVSAVSMESFSDMKTEIYNKMLNTIDHLDWIYVVANTNMVDDTVSVLTFHVNVSSGISYQSVSKNDVITSETYSDVATTMVSVDPVARSYTQNYLPQYTLADTPYIQLSERIVTGEDGIPCYSYRRNITNCPLASYCLVPQEIAFSYLKDFSLWDIENASETYLGRDCISLSGTPSPYIATKHGIDAFQMIVDTETGILLKFTGTCQGSVVRYLEVTEIEQNGKSVIPTFDADRYASYTTLSRG